MKDTKKKINKKAKKTTKVAKSAAKSVKSKSKKVSKVSAKSKKTLQKKVDNKKVEKKEKPIIDNKTTSSELTFIEPEKTTNSGYSSSKIGIVIAIGIIICLVATFMIKGTEIHNATQNTTQQNIVAPTTAKAPVKPANSNKVKNTHNKYNTTIEEDLKAINKNELVAYARSSFKNFRILSNQYPEKYKEIRFIVNAYDSSNSDYDYNFNNTKKLLETVNKNFTNEEINADFLNIFNNGN